MVNKNWYVIGLMSGTSLDGVDLIYVKFTLNQGYSFEILESKSVNYSELWKIKLQDAFTVSGKILSQTDAEYGLFLGELILDFIDEKELKKIDFIASHGHTIFHQPDMNYTVQIGSGAHISSVTGIKVICDFRTQDVALGGQGAPLVPIGDKLLFREYDFCLNIGGFANISYESQGERLAYDICPANIVLNHFTRKIGLEFDAGGTMASAGKVQEDLLAELNALSFYRQEQPKSLGFEFVVEKMLPIIERYKLPLNDVLRTMAEHGAMQIAAVINKVCGGNELKQTTVLITGGGAFNSFWIERISALCLAQIIVPSNEIIEFKEALIFAFLGVLRDQGEINCLKSVTGATRDHCGGLIYNV